MPVRMFKPKTLAKAYSLAKLQEITIATMKDQLKPPTRTSYLDLPTDLPITLIQLLLPLQKSTFRHPTI